MSLTACQVKELVMEILREHALEGILKADDEGRKAKFQTLISIESIAGEGCTPGGWQYLRGYSSQEQT
jgi:hypothetical protein